jgi:hypothetical protein
MKELQTLVAATAMISGLNDSMNYGAQREQAKLDRLHSYATHKANSDKKAKRKAIQKSKRKNRK